MTKSFLRKLPARVAFRSRRAVARIVGPVKDRAEPMLRVRRWEREGRLPPPPPEVKRKTLRGYARSYGLRTFVETGTFLGDTSEAMRHHVERVITIELSSELADRARRRFSDHPSVQVVEGDSGKLLPKLLADLDEAALFWLDGHYSEGVTARGDEDTPVRAELSAILAHPVSGHVILIDDARDFTGGVYPTVDEIRDLAAAYQFELRDDIIRLTPRSFRVA